MSAHPSVRELLDSVLDTGSFDSWDEPIDISAHAGHYRTSLKAAAERAGTDESIITGRGLVRGRAVAVVANEFGFLAGSIGRAAAQRIVSAVRRATSEGLPVLATTASGGTRMQEGTSAFVLMIDISRAIMDHKAAGLPYLVHLRHPTTGGVFASWGSLGHITVAEPGALIGFLGPKVFELLENRPFPPGIQVSENLANRGIIDAVVLAEELPTVVDRALGLLIDPPSESTRERRTGEVTRRRTAWESIEITRAAERPGVREVLRYGSDATVRLQGTDEGERDTAMIVAFARLDGVPCVVVGQDRTTQTKASPMGPAALREARRGMRLANELRLPLVSFIDTPGADLSPEAEQGAVAGEIARCISTMATMSVPTVSVLLGQGCGGGALALLPADVVVAAENAWLSPLPPEGASAIVHGDVDHAAEMSEQQGVGALDLFESGTVHHLVPEPDDDTPETFAHAVAAEVGARLRDLL
ncbi:carboxyl transferase domain-containing protein [Aeromicrobium sp.]|uniref:carboxyl transferase domain-containing protein n=1 Tax=Aeromicrobium sp. TaxID=1871063 RepID=UPI003D6AD52F